MMKGTGASPGIAYAQAVLWHEPASFDFIPHKCASPTREVDRFEAARRSLYGKTLELRHRAARIVGDDAAIFDVYSMILDDEEGLLEPLRKKIRLQHHSAEYAIIMQFGELARDFLHLENEYMRQRVDDVFALRDQLMRELLGPGAGDAPRFTQPCVVVARMLGPADIANMDLTKLEGIICEAGGYTGHTAIIARNLGIPTVLGVGGATGLVRGGDLVALDGSTGEIWVDPSDAEVDILRARAQKLAHREQAVLTFRGRPTISVDGHRVELAASISQIDELEAALACDAEAIGLCRTELLLAQYKGLADEEEQYEVYREVLQAAGGKTVTMRSYDRALNPPLIPKRPETNPALGSRGIRMSLGRPSMFRTQLRALLRASAHGSMRLLFPMVASPDELDDALGALHHIKEELRRESVPFDEAIPVGVYITIPATALMAEAMAAKVDFFTVGTGDLIQFTLALDRGHPDYAHLHHLYHPAVLQLLDKIATAAHKASLPCTLSVELPGFDDMLPTLMGLGFTGFTVNPGMILHCRRILSSCQYSEAQKMAKALLKMNSSAEVQQRLNLAGEHVRVYPQVQS